MGIFDIFKKPTKKEVNSERTERIRQQGRDGEDAVRLKWQLRGYEVERTGKGHDYYVRKRDPLTGRVIDSKYVEAKNGENAKLSPLQKKMKKKYGSRYIEDRVESSPFSTSGFTNYGYESTKKRSSHDDLFGFGSSGSGRKKKSSGYDDLFGF
ncbi:MAG: hypothetical protein QXX85_08365, partial [Candidatus Nitrosotenuis sp.]